MRNPLPLAAVLYAAGLVVGHFVPARWEWLLGASLALGLLALTWRPCGHVLVVLLPMAGWANLAVQTAVHSPHDLRRIAGTNAAYVTVRGTLLAAPVLRVHERAGRQLQTSSAEIQVAALGTEQGWAPAFGRVIASTPGILKEEFFSGRDVEVTGVLQPPKGPAAPGQFDYRAYLASRGVFHQIRCEGPGDWKISAFGASQSPPLTDRFARWALAVLGKGLPEDQSLQLVWAMVLGWKTGLTPEVAEVFMQSGTLHIFAISGMHIALIAGILVSLLRVLRVTRGMSGLVVVPLIWFYTAATGWQASAIRSTIMMTIVIAGWALKRPGNLINSLAAAGLIILIWDPSQLFQAGFQLSFFVVLGIALIVPPLNRGCDALLRPDPLLPPELRPRWKQWLDLPVRCVSTSLATSVAAWLGSMPLIAWYFYMVTPGSLLANLVIAPLSSIALMSSLGSLICGDWLPFLTELFNHGSWFWMWLMVRLSEWFASLPGAWFYIPRPPLVLSAVYYLLLGGVLSGMIFAAGRRIWACGGVLVVAATAAACAAWNSDEIRITVLPVRGGVVFIDEPGRSRDMLVDCGDAAAFNTVIKPFLRSQGVNRLASMLITHGDVAHAGGVEAVRTHFRVRQILLNAAPFRSRVYRELLGALPQLPVQCRKVARHDAAGSFRVLHPAAEDRFPQGANSAAVLRAELHGVRVLLLSDLGRAGQSALLGREADLSADVVIAGLSMAGDALGESLVRAINPRLVVVACPEFPASAAPNRRFRERLSKLGVPVIYTSDSGAAVFRFGKAGWRFETMDRRIIELESRQEKS